MRAVPKISVIVPIYNNEKYISRCVESILKQSFEDYEIILIDDGSKDNSGKICDEYVKKYEQIKVIHQENKGLATSRKVGVEAASGKFISFVDSDDYVDSKMLEILYAKGHDFDMISCAFRIVTPKGEYVENSFDEEYKDFYNNKEMIQAYFDKRYLFGSACGMLVKKELYERIDMCEGAVPGEEICTSLQLYQIANSVRAIKDPLYYYWQNEEGISHGGYTKRHKRGLENYIKICDQLVEAYPDLYEKISAYFCEYEMAVMTAMCRNDIYDEEVIESLQRELRKYMKSLWKNPQTALYFKGSALLIVANYRLFAFVFKRIRKYVGR